MQVQPQTGRITAEKQKGSAEALPFCVLSNFSPGRLLRVACLRRAPDAVSDALATAAAQGARSAATLFHPVRLDFASMLFLI